MNTKNRTPLSFWLGVIGCAMLILSALLIVGQGAALAEPAAPDSAGPDYQNPYPTPPPLVNTTTGFEGPGLCNPTGDPLYQVSLNQVNGQDNFCFTVDTISINEKITIQWSPTTALDDGADYMAITAPSGCTSGNVTATTTGTGVGTTFTFPTLNPIGNNQSLKTASYQCSAAAGTWQFCVNNGDTGATGGALNDFAVRVQNMTTNAFAYGRLASRDWGLDQGSYCPGCTFQMTVVANCGTEIHIPLSDYENMVNLRVYDSAGNLAPAGSWYVRRSTNGTVWCRYWAYDAGSATYKYNPDGDNCSGTGNCNPGNYAATCSTPLDPQVTLQFDAASWFDPRVYGTTVCNATDYKCTSCDDQSPGGAGEYMDIVIDLKQVGCGAIRLAADAGTTGQAYGVRATCNNATDPAPNETFSLYFTGQGTLPTQAVNPKPELSLKNFVVGVDGSTVCTPGSSYTANVIASVTAENLSCGAASNVPVVFDVTSGTGLSDQTVTIPTLNSFGETQLTANLGAITCVCNTPQTLAITASADPNNTITECSESAASGEPVCNPPAGSANSQTFSNPCNAVPLAATLADFSAVQEGDHIALAWETATELDNRGFNLYRGTSPDSWDRQLNAALIPSQAQGSAGGFVYTWPDADALVAGQTYYYWVQTVDVNGATTAHGPVSVLFSTPTAVQVRAVDSTAQNASVLQPYLAWLGLLAPLAAALLIAQLRKQARPE